MELRHYASQVLLSTDLNEKLASPDGPLTDAAPGPPLRPEWPGRPDNLRIAEKRRAPPMPKPGAFRNPARRAVAHHVMANHELQASEVMAMVLLAFPEAPTEFRFGLAEVMRDEQRHTRMHARRAEELGQPFGSLPVSGYIWEKSREFTSILDYLAGIPLTLEQRNLDHSQEFERWFLEHGDSKGAAIARTIHRDEIQHVAFGVQWLQRFKPPEQTTFEAFRAHLHWPLRPSRAVAGRPFDWKSRQAAGLDQEFLEALDQNVAEDESRPKANVPPAK